MMNILAGFKRHCNCENIFKVFVFTLVLFTMAGCVEQAVRVIVIPARAGGGGWVGLLFLALFIGAMFDNRKPLTPEQVQQQQLAQQKQEAEQRHREEMDLPAGLTPSSGNYVIANGNIAMTIAVVENRNLSPDHNFKVYSKAQYNRDSTWQREELLDVTVDNPDNLENAGLVDRRLLFHLKNSVNGNKVVITWNSSHGVEQDHKQQMPAASNSAPQPADMNITSIDNTQRQHNNSANDVDPSGL